MGSLPLIILETVLITLSKSGCYIVYRLKSRVIVDKELEIDLYFSNK